MNKFLIHTKIGFLALIFALISITVSAQTLSLDDRTILQSKLNRIGVNIGAIDNSDRGQVLKNLIGTANPGFEPLQNRQIWNLTTTGTATSFVVPDKNDGVPANYWQGGTFTVVESQSQGAELGCTGAIASNTGPNYPLTGATARLAPTVTVSSACKAPFSTGDVVILSKSAYPTPESWWENEALGGVVGTVQGGAELLSDTTDLCATCGSQALNMTATTNGSSATAALSFDNDYRDNIFVLMDGTYQLSFWAKSASGTPVLSVSASRLSKGGFNCGSYTPKLTSTWAQYTWTCTASESAAATAPGVARVSFATKGGSVYLDNVSFEKASSDSSNTTVLRDEVIQTLQNYYGSSIGNNPGMFRYGTGQNGETLANWTQPDYARAPTAGGTGYFVGPNGAGSVHLSLEDYLVICQLLNAEPYLEVPAAFTTTDAAHLIEFLAGTSNTTYGVRRAALGQEEPWTSVFTKIHLSFCNECWNGDAYPGQSLPYRSDAPNREYYYDYSVRTKDIFAAMRANSAYSASSFDLVMSAQTAVSFSMDAAIQRAHPDSIEIESYLYGTVNSFSTDAALWQPAVVEPFEKVTNPADPNNFYQSLHDYQSQTSCGASGKAACNVNIYEGGQNTIGGSIDQTHLDYISAGAGQGVVSALQPLLNLQYYGIKPQSFFGLAEDRNGVPNGATSKSRSSVVDMGGATNNVRPEFLGLALVNQSIIGSMYSCPIANNLTYKFAGSANGSSPIPALNNVPYLFAFCFENGSKRSLVLFNTDPSSSHTISLAGTNPPQGTVQQRQFAPTDLNDMNEAPTGTASNQTQATVSVDTNTLASPSSITLPAFSVTALDYTTGDATTAAMPTFSIAGGSYGAAQVVSISDTTAGATIYYTTNGSTPTTASTVYRGPIAVSSTQTLAAIAVKTGYANSPAATAVYAIGAVSGAPASAVTSEVTSKSAPATTVTISNTALASGLPRPGVNMGDNANYGSSQLLKSLIYGAAGYMPSGYWQTSFTCNTGGTNDTTHWYNNASGSGSQAYPANFFVGATYIAVNSSTGTSYGTGTITASTSNSGSSGIQFTLGTALSSACNSGNQDMMIVKLQNASPSFTTPTGVEPGVCSSATFNTSDTSPSSTNTIQSLQMPTGCQISFDADPGLSNATNTNSTLASQGISWINLNGTYTVTFKAKCLTAGCTLSFSVYRVTGTTYISSTTVSPTYNATPGAGWTTYTYTFTASETGSQPQNLQYVFKNTGTVLLQDADIIEGSTLAGNTSPYRDAVVRKLQALHPGSLRFMGGSDWCSDVADMIQPSNSYGVQGNNRLCGDNNYVKTLSNPPPMGYQARLQLCALIGADCWISVGQFNLPSDWTTLIKWLNTQGWISTFAASGHKIYLEEGNEAWNNGVAGGLWAGSGNSYGYLLGPNMAAAKSASGYNSSVIKLVGDSFTGSAPGIYSWTHNSLTVAGATTNGLPDFVDNAAYLLASLNYFNTSGSNVSATGSPFLDEWAEDANFNSNTATSIANNTAYAKTFGGSNPVGMAVYEANYSTLSGASVTQLQLDQVVAGVGQALSTAENALLMQSASKVTGPINVFTLPQNYTGYNNSNTPAAPLWGIVRYMACGPAQLSTCTDVDRPLSIALQVINNAIGSNNSLMSATQTGTPTFAYTANANGVASNSAVPYVVCSSYSNGSGQWTTICFNNNLTTSETVNLTGAGAPTGSVTETTFPGSSNLITDHNENTYTGVSSIAPMVTLPAPITTSGTTYTIPPASMIALTYSTSGSGTLATPSFSPAAGTYTGTQTVTITYPSGSTACVGINTTPTAPTPGTCGSGGTTYTGPITVSNSETINAIATEVGMVNSSVGSATYTITSPIAATPTFSPGGGTYASAQTVTVSDTTAGTTIYYTTNGSAPTTSSTVYSGPITVSSTETLEAIAVETGYTNSSVATAVFTINPTVPPPSFSPLAGTYTASQNVTISDTTGNTTIYYTTNGSTPTTSSTVYSGPIMVSTTKTVKAIAVAVGDANTVGTATYTILPVLPSPTFSLASGTYTTAQSVTISDATAGTTIYYTTNGTAPTTSSTKYAGAIAVSATETLEAIAVETGYTKSAAAIAAYTIDTPGTTYINYPSGGFTANGLSLNYGATVTGGLLQLTDGGNTESRSAGFATAVPVQSFITDFTFQQLNAMADGMTFTIQASSSWPQGQSGGGLGYGLIPNSVAVKFDLFNNGGEGSDSTGLYTDGAWPIMPAVDLTSTGINLHSGDVMHAHIVYDGTNLTMTLTDTATYAVATEVFPVNIPSLVGGNTAYVGFTGGTGGQTSTQNVLSWTYTSPAAVSAATPTFSPAGGTYSTSQSVTLSDATAGATMYYTTDGTAPTTSSTKYTGAITVSATETLQAIAVETGYINSSVASATYTITAGGSSYINYPTGGFTANGLSLDYGATVNGGLLQLTDGAVYESRSAWFATPVPVQSFTTDFTFQQLNATADGMTFTIQSSSSPIQGGAGGGLGYQNIPNSVAVKFDLYSNNGEGPDSTGLYTAGAAPTMPSVDLSSTGINFHSGDVMHAHIVYDGTNLTMTLTDTVTSATVTEVFPVNIPSLVGGNTAYVGFTGGTGGGTATQNVLSWTYTSTAALIAAVPTFSPKAGTYAGAQKVTIADSTRHSEIYYTTNGRAPSTSSTRYLGPIEVSASETLQAMAVATRYTASPAAKAAYNIATALLAPKFSPAGGTYTSSRAVTMSDIDPGAITYYFTTNGTTPTTSSSKYTGPIRVSATEKLEAIAVEKGHVNSAVTSAYYTIETALAAPKFSPAGGTYTSAQTVTIRVSDSPAISYYFTTNGSTPTTSSTKYTGPIVVSATEKLQAIAVERGHANSPVTAAAYTIEKPLAAPKFSPIAGTYKSAQTVTISDATGDTTLYFTTNGSIPTTKSAKYKGAIKVSATEKIEAIAVKAGHANSPVAAAAYTLSTP